MQCEKTTSWPHAFLTLKSRLGTQKGSFKMSIFSPLGKPDHQSQLELQTLMYNRGGHLCSVAPSLTIRNNGDWCTVDFFDRSSVEYGSSAHRVMASQTLLMAKPTIWAVSERHWYFGASFAESQLEWWNNQRSPVFLWEWINANGQLWEICLHPKVHQLTLGANWHPFFDVNAQPYLDDPRSTDRI